MTELLGGLLVLACLLAILLFMMRGTANLGGSGLRLSSVSAEDTPGWVEVAVGLMAVAAVWAPKGGGAASLGATIGVLCAVAVVNPVLRQVRVAVLSVVGVVASFSSVAIAVGGSACAEPSAGRWLLLILTIGAFVAGSLLGLLRSRQGLLGAGLGLFAVVELGALATSPLGQDLAPTPRVVTLAIVVIIGFLTGLAPAIMLVVVGLSVSVAALYSSMLTTTGCGFDGTPPQATVVISGFVVYWLILTGAGRILTRGA